MVQTPDEKTYVEIPFIQQLKALGWDHVEGDIDVPYLTERESFREILLRGLDIIVFIKIYEENNG